MLAIGLALTLGLVASRASADDASCIAATEGALTLRQHGKLHDALKQLAACADVACPAEVKAECSRRIDDVKAAMPTLILAAKDGAGNDLAEVKVSMDGAPLVATLDGRPIAIDPGEHVFVFEEAGQAPVEKKLVLLEGERDRREGVVIGPLAPSAPAAPSALPQPSSWSTQKTLAVVGAGLGVVGVGLGATWGAYAISSQNQEKSDCASAGGCSKPKQASADYSAARENATASTVSFAVGAAFLAAGAVLWFTAPSVRVAPTVGSHDGGLVLGGSF
jgi:hypothetical protein